MQKKKRKKGGQPNNKNASGHGAPYGNQNAVKHGLYCVPWHGIPHTPANDKVFAFMKECGFPETIDNFNACKKLMKKLKS